MSKMSNSSRTHNQHEKAAHRPSSTEDEFYRLMRRYQELRDATEKVEDKMMDLYYDRFHDGPVSPQLSTRSSHDVVGSGSGLLNAPQELRQKEPQLAMEHPTKEKGYMKNGKRRKGLSEEEKNRNINKVLLRESVR
ncbi:hypothetical protein ACHAPU_009403 [Fusarium lateritium]